jgi:hypothetical protein
LSSSGTANRICPHGSDEDGIHPELMILTAAGLNADGSIRLFTNGARIATWRPLLHAGEAAVVKSPAIIAAVGTNARLSFDIWRERVRWYAPKKNSLSLTIGPPRVPPNWFLFSPSFCFLPSAPTGAK